MPELPEVENARCRLNELVDRSLALRFERDPIVCGGLSGELDLGLLTEVGRKGKVLWLRGEQASVGIHLGMSGAICGLSGEGLIYGHGTNGNKRMQYVKCWIGDQFVLSDPRRLARIWQISGRIEDDPRIAKLGADAWLELPDDLAGIFLSVAPIKSLLLDQHRLSGLGNYLADEILFEARISPFRAGRSLSVVELKRLRLAIRSVLATAIQANAEHSLFPAHWLFHVRWRMRGISGEHAGRLIRRDVIGGRSTLWCPDIQT